MAEAIWQTVRYSIPLIANLLFRIFGLGFNKKRLWIGLIVFVILTFPGQYCLIRYAGVDFYAKFSPVYLVIVNVSVCLIITSDDLWKTLFFLAGQINISFVFIMLCNLIKHLAHWDNWQLIILLASVYAVLLFISIKFLSHPFRFMGEQIKSGKIGAIAIPLICLGACILITAYSPTYFGDAPLYYFAMVFLIEAAFVLYLVIFYENLKTIYEHNKKELSNELLQAEIDSYQRSIQEASINRHDIKFHNSILRQMLEKNDIEGAKKYLSEYDDGVSKSKRQAFCQNSVADAAIRLYKRKFEEKGIKFSVVADIPEQLPIDSAGLGSILSNLFTNAYEACLKVKDKKPYVIFNAEDNDGIFQMEMKNSSKKVANKNPNGLPSTTKKGGGTGLISVKTDLDRCGGLMRIKQKKDEFTVQIVIGK